MKKEYFILFILSLMVFSMGLGVGIITPFLPSYAKEMGSTTSLISSAFSAGFLTGPVLSGIFYDLTGIYGTFISCAVFGFLILLITSFIFFKNG